MSKRVLVACEFSGRVRDAFIAQGHDAVSVDLIDSEAPGPHITGDVRDVLGGGWDIMVAFPPCTYLALSGARWWPGRQQEQSAAIAFVRELAGAPIDRVAIENPIGKLSTEWRKPDQIVHPWWFDEGETKATCLWLKGLPPLLATVHASERVPRQQREAPGPDRWKRRSRTPLGLAAAMAQQWGGVTAEPDRARPAEVEV